MEFDDGIVDSLENKSIFVTGSTGFLAKLFVEKVLRVQPNVKKLYLLIRASDTKSATERLHDEVIGKELFQVLREKYGGDLDSIITKKVITVLGDVIYGNMGVHNSELLEKMWKDIDIIVNVAANTKFDERYDVALDVNSFGSKNVLDFAKKCVKLEMFLHVSTAYVCGEKSGLIQEKPFQMGEALNGTLGLDIQQEQRLVQDTLNELQALKATKEEKRLAMKELGMKRARLYGWPNTYVFTKAMGEMLVGNLRGNLPLVIIRPTVVTSTYKEPFPGWIEGARHIDILTIGYGKGKLTCFLGDPTLILDLIPGDMVVNAMIVAMVTHLNQSSEHIYHVGSSMKNPVNPYVFVDYVYDYFLKNPLISKDGKPIKVKKPTILTSVASFQSYMTLHYILPLKVFALLNALCCDYSRQTCIDMNRKIKFVMSLVELYAPYIFFKGIFDDLNTEKLRVRMKSIKSEADTFYFDPKCIDWDDYFINIHLPGVLKYNLKW
ncbi:Fatty acyl-coa reductase [Thalictrum thalictroides]|uniref:Fatty acyl-CoA reductase n=1 Tax=Thalictrum thalictroides TaxID=46969 RepID=A0A7J6XA61_THATH|nr:Fatty acyl-coa reductase [Thalictrum thalictroides]